MEMLQEKFGKDVMTEELQSEIENRINQLVEEKTDAKLKVQLEAKIDELEEQNNEFKGKIQAEADEYKNQVLSDAKELYDSKIDELEEQSENYKKKIEEEVMQEAKELYDSKIEELEEQSENFKKKIEEEVMQEAKDLYDSKIDELECKSEQFKNEMAQEAAELFNEKVENIANIVEKFADSVVDEFISENAKAFEINESEMRNKAILHTLTNACKMAGVTANMIDECKENTPEHSMREMKLMNMLKEANLKLKDLEQQNENLVRLGVIRELAEGLTPREANRFEAMANNVKFTKSSAYLSELKELRESCKNDFDHKRSNNDTNVNEHSNMRNTLRKMSDIRSSRLNEERRSELRKSIQNDLNETTDNTPEIKSGYNVKIEDVNSESSMFSRMKNFI